MYRIYIFAATLLFWSALGAASLLKMQSFASPTYKMPIPTYRSILVLPTAIAQNNKVIKH